MKVGDLIITLNIHVRLTFWDALKLRIAGRETREMLLGPVVERLRSEAELPGSHPRAIQAEADLQ